LITTTAVSERLTKAASTRLITTGSRMPAEIIACRIQSGWPSGSRVRP
jgi:hypothetical protein